MEIILQGKVQGQSRSWTLKEGTYRLGRGTHNEVLLSDPSVSRGHAELVVGADQVMITDLGSRNGTWINDRQAHTQEIVRPGDGLRLGNVELVLTDEATELPSKAPSQAMLAVDDQVRGTVHLPWDSVKSEFDTESRLDQNLLKVVTDAGPLLVGQQPLEKLFETVLDLVERLVTTRRIVLLLLDDDDATPNVCAARPPQSTSDEKLMLSKTLMDTVIQGRDSLLVTDAQADPRFGGQESIVAMDIRSALVAPLFDNEKVIGLVYADTNDPRVRYDLDHLRIFTMLSNLIAIKITNTRLLEDQRAKERMEQEMATAARIQRGILPAELPTVPAYEILATLIPCHEAAGDLYDAHREDDQRIYLTLGDVSGKGIGSALLMSHVMASMRVLYSENLDPATMVNRLHSQLLKAADPANYATLFFACLNPSTHTLEYVNAGHNPPFLLLPDGTVSTLDATGMPVGLLDGASFDSNSTTMPEGSLLFIFSDGITEALSKEEFYGDDRLVDCLKRHFSRPLDEISSELLDEIRAFQGDTPTSDDITMFMLRRSMK